MKPRPHKRQRPEPIGAMMPPRGAVSAAQTVWRMIMRRFAGLVSAVIIVLLGSVAVLSRPPVAAQEATPAAEEMAGVTFDALTFTTGVDVAGPFDVVVVRVALRPGATVPIDPTDPTVGILLVEYGTLTVRADGEVRVTRGAGFGRAMETAAATGDVSTLSELVAAGEAVTLKRGDAAYLPANAAWEIRNESQRRAEAIGFLVIPPGGMTVAATPAP